MTLNDDMDRLHREWAHLKAVLWAERWRWGPAFALTYLAVLACVLLATLVTLP